MELNIRISGAAGQGMQTIGYILSKVFARGGHEVFSVMDYMSRVRGGHNYFQIRVSDKKVNSHTDMIDVLVALDSKSVELEKDIVKEDGIIIYDETAGAGVCDISGKRCFSIPFSKIATEVAGSKVYSNSVAIGVVLGLMEYDLDVLYDVMNDFFSHKKDEEVAKSNILVAKKGVEYAKGSGFSLDEELIKSIECIVGKKMLINGNEAIALGALAAGCRFFCSYPMTPSTSIFVTAAKYSHEFNAVVEQAEDEIAAMNMIIGASYAGVKSMTTTSGGGFCLMTEGLGFAAMAEIPTVIVNSQRSGPSTGLPTRTEQGDLLFVINASHGDFVRAVFAPSTPKDAFHLTIKAFNVSEKFQIPVIILDDQYLADTYVTMDEFDLKKVKYKKYTMSDDELKGLESYDRYAITDNGISPRALPGQSERLVVCDSDEHTADGHLTEDIEAAVQMKDKRARKLWYLMRDLALPRSFGSPEAKYTLITWGSTFSVAKEFLQKKGDGKFNLINVQEIWPISSEFFKTHLDGKKGITVEGNSTGQLAKLIQQVSGVRVDSILKYDGRPFTVGYIEDKLSEKGVI